MKMVCRARNMVLRNKVEVRKRVLKGKVGWKGTFAMCNRDLRPEAQYVVEVYMNL